MSVYSIRLLSHTLLTEVKVIHSKLKFPSCFLEKDLASLMIFADIQNKSSPLDVFIMVFDKVT